METTNLTHFSLCTGIGGIDLAAEWAGFETIGQCEIDEYASKVLEKNFKGVKNYGDIRAITNERLTQDGINDICVLSAGFPCQPYSLAGKGKGDGDERDLWGEVARCVKELKPKWFVGENTPGLFSRGNQRYFQRVVDDLVALGYCVSWGIWGACDVGAPHQRERVFIVAYAIIKRLARPIQRHQEVEKLHEGNKTIKNDLFFTAQGIYGLRDCKQIRRGARVSNWVDKLRCLGNAVVPQQVYPIFEVIAEIELSWRGYD
jgi:DNA (cytosine-5)-methyltransferase 1